jgi:deoxyribodipyrimidine photo-lyase
LKNKINIVWFKRDLRLQDHEPLQYAIESDFTCILLYIFEPELISNDDSDIRHWRFVYQSLIDIRKKLEPDNSLTIFYGSSLEIFKKLSAAF